LKHAPPAAGVQWRGRTLEFSTDWCEKQIT